MVVVREDGSAPRMSRFSAFAMRTVSPCMPREREASESASTTRWTWFPSTVNSITRSPKRSRASSNDVSRARKQRPLRRFQTWRATRNVT
jgi:hypothetical protein